MGSFFYEYKVGRKWVDKQRVAFNLINYVLAESCNRGWLHFNDSCYYFFSRQLDFHAARGSCGTGAELVSIENEAENKFVSGQMRR